MELGIRTDQDSSVCTVTLEGEVDVYTAPRLKDDARRAARRRVRQRHRRPGEGRVHRQLGAGRARRAPCGGRARRDGAVRIVCTRDSVLKIFRITGLDKVFPIFSDAAEAREF